MSELYTVLSGQVTALSSLTDKFRLYDQNLSGIVEQIDQFLNGEFDYIPAQSGESQSEQSEQTEDESQIESDLAEIKEQLGIED